MADLYVDSSRATSGNGTSLATAYKSIGEAILAMAPGDRIRVKGATPHMRERLRIPPSKGGLTGLALSRIEGIPDADPTKPTRPWTLNGSVGSTGWAKCDPDAALELARFGAAHGNIGRIYKKNFPLSTFPQNDPAAANICEDGIQLDLGVHRREITDPYFPEDPKGYFVADSYAIVNAQKTSLTDASAFAGYTKAQIEASTLYHVVSSNREGRSKVTFVAPDTIRILEPGAQATNAASNNLFSLHNFAPALKQGEWVWFNNGDGTCTIYVWPRLDASPGAGKIEYSVIDKAIVFEGSCSNFRISNFVIRQFVVSNANPAGGNDIGVNTGVVTNSVVGAQPGANLQITDYVIRDCLNNGRHGNSVAMFRDTDDLRMLRFKHIRCRGFFGWMLSGTYNTTAINSSRTMKRALIQDFDLEYCSDSPSRMFTVEDSVVAFGTVTRCGSAAHGNIINYYMGCKNNLIWGYNAHHVEGGYATVQNSGGTFYVCSEFPASRAGIPTATGFDQTGSGRAMYPQNNVPVPSGLERGGYFNCRFLPDPKFMTTGNSVLIGDVDTPTDVNDMINCFFHGLHGSQTWGPEVGEVTNNVQTHTTSRGVTVDIDTLATNGKATNNAAVPYAELYGPGFTYPANSKKRTGLGVTPRNIQSRIDAWKLLWPHFDGWGLDMQRKPIVAGLAFMGPVVSNDADMSLKMAPAWVGNDTGGDVVIDPTPDPEPDPVVTSITLRKDPVIRVRVTA